MFALTESGLLSSRHRGGLLAVGNFDGVHRGHQALIRRLRERADALGTRAFALTFEPRPVEVLRPGSAVPALTWIERKVDLLKQAGAHGVGVFQTGPWLLHLTAREFFDQILLGRLQARGMVEGPTFGFGRDRGGDAVVLGNWCREAGLSFEIVSPTVIDGGLISTTRIRQALAEGRVDQARSWLSRPHRIRGLVVRGAGRGAGLGFPTANLNTIQGLVPAHGVYAAWAFPERKRHPVACAVHIGPNATFGAVDATVEAHLLDFEGDLYGQHLALDFVERVRETIRFDDVPALLDQIGRDVQRTRTLLAEVSQF